jgi:phage gp46-like protein
VNDLALRFDASSVTADLAVEANDLAVADDLEAAVQLSLFLDRRAEASDVLPSEDPDRRGWWGDAVPSTDAADFIGSRLWLLRRETGRAGLLSRAEQYAREALAWLAEDGVASSVGVAADLPSPGLLRLAVTVTRAGAEDRLRDRAFTFTLPV